MKPFIIVSVWLPTFQPILLPQVNRTIRIFFWFVWPTLLPKLGKFGLGIFSQDSAESLNQLLKSMFLTMTNRGGSAQVDTTLPPGVADRFHRESLAMKQTLQYIFLYFLFRLLHATRRSGRNARTKKLWMLYMRCSMQIIVNQRIKWRSEWV